MNTTGLIFIYYTRLMGTTRGGTWKQTVFWGGDVGRFTMFDTGLFYNLE